LIKYKGLERERKGRDFIFTHCISATNKELNKCTVHPSPNKMSIIIFRKMRWAGHVVFTEEMRNANTILDAKPKVQKTSKGAFRLHVLRHVHGLECLHGTDGSTSAVPSKEIRCNSVFHCYCERWIWKG